MDLYYEVHGAGEPIVMIHSPGVDSREWKHVVPLLANTNQVITFDLRGTGRSPSPQHPLNMVEDLKNVLDHLDISKAAIVGHSMGGQGAVDFALTYPSMAERLVLIAPSLTGFIHSEEFTQWMAKVNSYAPDIQQLVQFSLDGPNYSVTMAGPERDFLLKLHTEYVTKVFTEWKSFEVQWPEPPAIERLEDLQPATLFIHGIVEWEDMFAIAEQFKRVPVIQSAQMSGADHMIPLTHPTELAHHIKQFLNRSN